MKHWLFVFRFSLSLLSPETSESSKCEVGFHHRSVEKSQIFKSLQSFFVFLLCEVQNIKKFEFCVFGDKNLLNLVCA